MGGTLSVACEEDALRVLDTVTEPEPVGTSSLMLPFDVMVLAELRRELENPGEVQQARTRAGAVLAHQWRSGTAARFLGVSSNRKLSPVVKGRYVASPSRGARAPASITPVPPFVSSTYTPIGLTCPSSCEFKDRGCYAQRGITGILDRKLARGVAGRSATQVIREEAQLIRDAFNGALIPQDGARGGRDLRLHVGGDVGSAAGARLLAGAAENWQARRGGSVWTYTHWAMKIPRAMWGRISVLASVETVEGARAVIKRGYPAALVLPAFPSHRAFSLPGLPGKVVPCPAETKPGTTCADCRLCLDRDLLKMGVTIGFSAHGNGQTNLRKRLVVLNGTQPSLTGVL